MSVWDSIWPALGVAIPACFTIYTILVKRFETLEGRISAEEKATIRQDGVIQLLAQKIGHIEESHRDAKDGLREDISEIKRNIERITDNLNQRRGGTSGGYAQVNDPNRRDQNK